VPASPLDLRDIKGQETAKRALEVAAAGGHHLLMIGPPGSGKSMLAARLPGLLPPLDPAEALEISMIHSVAGLLHEGRLMRQRPFRDPHHSASLPALIGGGHRGRPGEISLAHLGVLFLDELPEFRRNVLEPLRQPLEERRITVARGTGALLFPAAFQLVAAMNPCPCGWLGDPADTCRCTPPLLDRYRARVSGPLLDRIDIRGREGRTLKEHWKDGLTTFLGMMCSGFPNMIYMNGPGSPSAFFSARTRASMSVLMRVVARLAG